MPNHYQQYIHSAVWRKKRREALEFYGGKCAKCGRSEHLEVHHLHYRTLGREEMADLLVECRDCHDCDHEAQERHDDPLSREFRRMVESW